jgi:hypothetical protein
MSGRSPTEVNRLLSCLRWHSDRLEEQTSCGNQYEMHHHQIMIRDLVARIHAIDSSRAISDVVRELMS